MSTPLDAAEAADRARCVVDRATWVVVGLGLVFTAVNVQQFAAAGAPAWSPAWCVAWLLDPMVSVLVLAVVRAEQVTARWQITMPWSVAATKWAAFAATYAMNTWSSWRDVIPSGVVLHSVPPVFVLLAAQVAPALRDRLTEAVHAAEAAVVAPAPAPPGVLEEPPCHEVPEPLHLATVSEPVDITEAARDLFRRQPRAGRSTVMTELGVNEYAAKNLIRDLKPAVQQ